MVSAYEEMCFEKIRKTNNLPAHDSDHDLCRSRMPRKIVQVHPLSCKPQPKDSVI